MVRAALLPLLALAIAAPAWSFNAELTRPLAFFPPSATPTPVPNAPTAPPVPARSYPVVRAEPMRINDYPFDNRAKYRAGFVGTRATLNLGTRTVGVPVALRVGSQVGLAAANFNPWVAGANLAVLALPFVLDWFGLFNAESETTLGVDGANNVTIETPQILPGYDELDSGGVNIDLTTNAAGQSIRDIIANRIAPLSVEGNCNYNDGTYTVVRHYKAPTYPAGFWCGEGATEYVDIDTCDIYPRMKTQYRLCPGLGGVVLGENSLDEVTQADLDVLAQLILNPQMLAELGTPIPVVDEPIINPVALPEGDVLVGPDGNPAPELMPRPIRYPNGNPILIPDSDPPLYTQPWYEVTGNPTPQNPWQVVVVHVVTTTNDPTPVPDPDGPFMPPVGFYTDCDKFPGSISCLPVGDTPDAEEVPLETRTIALQDGPTFGGAGCPADLSFTLRGQTYTGVDMAQPCAWISGLVKPVILVLAFISAVSILRTSLKTKKA